MSKVALMVFGGCVFFGLLKLVVSVPPHVEEGDLRMAEAAPEENQEEERIGAGANTVSFAAGLLRPRHNAMSAPTPNPIHLTECYVCTDCPKVLTNTTSKVCPFTLDSAKRGKCVVYAEQYKHMKRPWYIRGCASERGTCTDIKKAHSSHADIVTLVLCNECEGDRCNTNGASRSITDITMAFFAMVVTPLVAKYTLS
ncbi:uncharacterized protein LOC120631182 [Pararge aegeria]|uniref:Jg20062 protein n=1 Tax=Pararge aegeria aegeria TaxID=348720 RepID=A0A8S4SIE2_9NEOP|nr:uncharacterized protein LOC120631182 [Pararge aegeria]CAH2266877.1 jg20062 [Pararge aegeria aegeria]